MSRSTSKAVKDAPLQSSWRRRARQDSRDVRAPRDGHRHRRRDRLGQVHGEPRARKERQEGALRGLQAQERAAGRLRACRPRRRLDGPTLMEGVRRRIVDDRQSPEQVDDRMRLAAARCVVGFSTACRVSANVNPPSGILLASAPQFHVQGIGTHLLRVRRTSNSARKGPHDEAIEAHGSLSAPARKVKGMDAGCILLQGRFLLLSSQT